MISFDVFVARESAIAQDAMDVAREALLRARAVIEAELQEVKHQLLALEFGAR